MFNRRNKLLLSLAKKRKQSDVYNSEDLSNLLDNVNNGETVEAQSLNPPENNFLKLDESCELFEKSSFDICVDSSGLELLGDATFKEVIDDLNHTRNIISTKNINIKDTAPEHENDYAQCFSGSLVQKELLDTYMTINKSRSVTPIPCEYLYFGSSPINMSPSNKSPPTLLNQVVDRIQEQSTTLPSESQPKETIAFEYDSANSSPKPQSPFQVSTSATTSAAEASSECSSPSSATGRKRRKFSIDTSKRKRKSKKDNWLDTKRKLLVNHGKKHLSRGGKEQQDKIIKPACENCKFQCRTKLTIETRTRIFETFWDLGDHTKQWQFIGKYTKRFTKKRITTDNDSKRNYSVHYFLPVLSDERVIKVCKTMFKNTLNVSNQFVQSGIDKYNDTTGVCESDKRGVHSNKKRVLTDAVIKGVCDHVKSFCPVESHYIRKDSNKMYLDSDLNFPKMFKMYSEWTTENNIDDINKVSTLRQYRDVINSHLNIGFFIPKKDQCDICTANKNKSNNTEGSNIDYLKHIQNKNIARSLKSEDKKFAQCKPTEVSAATFDFQKILCTPHGETSSFYYKRKLSVFNFTVFDMGNKRGICYMWDETTAKRGSNEVASCLYNYITTVAAKGIKDIRLWSDNCGGQNRNRSVFAMYLYAAKQLKVHISHRFLEKGHTQQEGDSVHALIERNSKRKMIYTPQEWYTCVRWCKVNADPYEVIEVSSENILDFKSNIKEYVWLKNFENEKVKWNLVREIKVDPNNPYVINYRYDLNEAQSMSINCCRRANTRRCQNSAVEVKNAYTSSLPITSAKYKDLISLCEQNLIPSRYHVFYKNLKHTEIEGAVSDEED